MAEALQVWRGWVEGRKGEAIKIALTTRPSLPDYRIVSGPFLTVTSGNDFGTFRMAEVWTVCPLAVDRSDTSDCHYLYRKGTVPARVHEIGRPDNAVARWMVENFDVDAVVRALKAADVPADADMWLVGDEILFSGLPSPVPMLTENVEMVTVNSRDCPAFHEAVKSLDAGRVEWRTDLFGVGEDKALPPPRPHSIRESYGLRLRTETGAIDVSGSDDGLWDVVGPVLLAASACEPAAT